MQNKAVWHAEQLQSDKGFFKLKIDHFYSYSLLFMNLAYFPTDESLTAIRSTLYVS